MQLKVSKKDLSIYIQFIWGYGFFCIDEDEYVSFIDILKTPTYFALFDYIISFKLINYVMLHLMAETGFFKSYKSYLNTTLYSCVCSTHK